MKSSNEPGKMNISIFRGTEAFETKVVDEVLAFDSLNAVGQAIKTHLWSPSVFEPNNRSKANFNFANILSLDVDDGCSLEEARALFADFRHLIGTTKSHQKSKNGKPPCDRLRILLPLRRPIVSAEEFDASMNYLLNQFPFADSAAKDCARFFYPCTEVVSINENGKEIEVIEPTKSRVESPRTSIENGFLIKNGSRNTTLASIAGSLRNRGLSQNTIETNLLFINENECETPLLQSEVLSIARSISRYETKNQRPEGYSFVSVGNLLKENLKPTPWVVEGLIPEGGLSVATSKPKVGKSTWARYGAYCVATGTPFLDRNVKQGPVLYLALEEHRSELQNQFLQMGIKGHEPLHIHVGLPPSNPIKALKSAIQELKPVLVVIDTLGRFMKIQDIHSYSEVTSAFDPLIELMRSTDTSVLLLHHSPKGERDGGDAFLGSTGIFASIDVGIILTRDKDDVRTIKTMQRMGADTPETILEFNPDNRSFALGQSKFSAEAENTSNEILDVLERSDGCMEEDVLLEEVTGSTDKKRKALRRLFDTGRIFRGGKGRKGSPFKYSRHPIKENEPEE